jgi:hypothetical protein
MRTSPERLRSTGPSERNGPTGEVQLYFDEGRVSFTNLEKAENFGGF